MITRTLKNPFVRPLVYLVCALMVLAGDPLLALDQNVRIVPKDDAADRLASWTDAADDLQRRLGTWWDGTWEAAWSALPESASPAPPAVRASTAFAQQDDGGDGEASGGGGEEPQSPNSQGLREEELRQLTETDAVGFPEDESFKTLPLPEIPGEKAGASLLRPPRELIQLMAGKADLDGTPLIPGWNLLSTPEEPADTDPGVVLAPVVGAYTRAYAYDNCDPADPWKVYDPADLPNSDLTTIDHKIGFWLEATSAVDLSFDDTLPATTEIPICPGWNLIGYPAGQERHVTNALHTIEGKYIRVYGFDATDPDDPWEVYSVGVPEWGNDLSLMYPGRGYWVLATEAATLTIANEGPDPVVDLISPADLDVVTDFTDVIGTVESPILESWRLTYERIGETEPIELATGVAPIIAGTLATFDPTLLVNGLYELTLEATDLDGRVVEDSIAVSVEGGLKLGNFAIEFMDLAVNLAGLDIEVLRRYDSRRRDMSSDFGFGWDLVIRQGSYRNNREPGEGWQITSGFLPCENVQETKSHVTTIRLADREIYRFRVQLTHSAPSLGGCFARASFRLVDAPAPGATLEILGNDEVFYENSSDRVIDIDTFQVYEPQNVRLTTRDGRVFDLSIENGVTGLEDSFGNQLSISDDGITHSNGESIDFIRDASDRIIEVSDTANRRLVYGYGPSGDLLSFRDQGDRETRFLYEEGHYLSEVIDSRGIRAVRYEYDDDGRLIRVVDANGQATSFVHDVDANREVLTDRLGNVQVLEYDSRGNVVRQVDSLGNETTLTFDSRDRKLSETNPLGHMVTYTYSPAGDLLSFTNALDEITTYTRDDAGRVLTRTNPGGETTTYRYGDAGQLLEVEDPLGAVTEYVYDGSGNRTKIVDPLGNTTTYSYDSSGRLTRLEEPAGKTTTYSFDARDNLVSQTTSRTLRDGTVETLTTSHQYDDLDRLIETTMPDGSVRSAQYDALGNTIATTDSLGRQSRMVYDDQNRLVRTIFGDEVKEERSYDAEGNLTKVVDAAGRATEYGYDSLLRPKSVTYPGGAVVSNTYDAAGNLIAVTNPRGHVLRQEFDAAGRRTKVIDPLGGETSFEYDANGRQTLVTDPEGRQVASEFDAAGRVVRQVLPDGAERLAGYDLAGRKVTETDAMGAATAFAYDPAGRLISVLDPLGNTTQYDYDELGSLISIEDAMGRMTEFGYDEQGRAVSKTLPDGSVETKTYDAAGNVIRRTDLGGRVTQMSYDDRNRLVERLLPDGSREQSTYHPIGTRATVTDDRGTTSFSYDERNRLAQVEYPDGRAVSHTYDEVGNRTEMILSSGARDVTVRYEFDALDRIVSVEDPEGREYGFAYDPVGNRLATTLPNGIQTEYVYDSRNQVVSLSSYESATGTSLQDFTYVLDAGGRRTSVADVSGAERLWEYDALYRLTGETASSGGAATRIDTFAYDPVGNRTLFERQLPPDPATSALSTYDVRDRQLTHGGQTLTWNAVGDLLGHSAGTTYQWDARGRLREAVALDGSRVEHLYDVDGLLQESRIERPDGSVETKKFFVDTVGLPTIVGESDASGAIRTIYVRAAGELLALIRDTESKFYLLDGLGSVRLLTDESGVVSDRYEYDAVGNLLEHEGSDPQSYLFVGERRDSVSGAYYLRTRWMDPSTGRFLSMDPFEGFRRSPQSLNKYAYAENDPVNFSDPTGLFSAANMAVTAAVIGLAASIVAGVTFHVLALTNFPNDIWNNPASAVILGVQWSIAAGRLVRWIRHPIAVGLSLGLAFASFLAMMELLIPIKDPTRVWIYAALGVGIDPVTNRGPFSKKPSAYAGLAWNVDTASDYQGWSFCSGFSSHAASKRAGLPVNACAGLPPDDGSDPAASVTLNKFNRYGAVASTGSYYWYLGEAALPMEDIAPYIPTSLSELPGWLDSLTSPSP